jgi:hypothetical protein
MPSLSTPGAFQPTLKGAVDAFVWKVDPNCQTVYFTYLGGSAGPLTEQGNGIAVDAAGNAYIAGQASSTDFPMVDAFQGTLRGISDGFVTKINPTGTALVYSTFLGGSGGNEAAFAIRVDSADSAYVTGKTDSADFPVLDTMQSFGGTTDAFVTKLNAAGNGLAFSTFLGGNDREEGAAIALGGNDVYVAGYTVSANYPVVAPLQASLAGPINAFIARLSSIALTVSSPTLVEGHAGTTDAVFDVTLASPASQTVVVNYSTGNGSATAPSDYAATTGSLTFLAGETSKTVHVPVLGDTLDEDDETFQLAVGGFVGIATIQDDDPLPVVAIADAAGAEGDAAGSALTFTLTLTPASGRVVSVSYASADGAAVAGSDYTSVGGTLSIPAGATSATISVPLVADRIFEADEVFALNLSAPVNATIAGSSNALGTILNDDAPGLSVQDATVQEGRTGTRDLVFTVVMAPTVPAQVTVDFATSDGTALAGQDYQATAGTLTFPANATSATINVPVTGDPLPEPNETLFVDLSNAVGAPIASSRGTGTIRNDDGQADFNADGKTDIVWRRSTGDLEIWMMDAVTRTSSVSYGNVVTRWEVEFSGDFNGDGFADLLWRDIPTGRSFIWMLRGGPQVIDGETGDTSLQADTSWRIAGVGDFDADGKTDVWWSRNDGTHALWLMDGKTVKSTVSYAAVATRWSVQYVADFNGDGYADLLWRDSITGRCFTWILRGGPTVVNGETGYTSLQADTSWRIAGVGDFDGDGKTDVWWSRNDRSQSLWLMDGVNVKQQVNYSSTHIHSGWTVVSPGDFNGDGLADVLWRYDFAGVTYMWFLLPGTYPVTSSGYTSVQNDLSWRIDHPR